MSGPTRNGSPGVTDLRRWRLALRGLAIGLGAAYAAVAALSESLANRVLEEEANATWAAETVYRMIQRVCDEAEQRIEERT